MNMKENNYLDKFSKRKIMCIEIYPSFYSLTLHFKVMNALKKIYHGYSGVALIRLLLKKVKMFLKILKQRNISILQKPNIIKTTVLMAKKTLNYYL